MAETNFKNAATFAGKIVNKRKTPKSLILTLITDVEKHANFPKIVFFNEKAEEINKEYEIGDNVFVIASMQSSKRIIDEKETYSQSIIGSSIERAKTALELGSESEVKGYRIFSENKIEIIGTVRNIYSPRKDFISARISIPNGKRYSTISMMYFGKNCGDILNDIHFGDTVSIIAKIESSKKTEDGKTTYYESVVIEDIGKVK